MCCVLVNHHDYYHDNNYYGYDNDNDVVGDSDDAKLVMTMLIADDYIERCMAISC